jgi:hypothetical protein
MKVMQNKSTVKQFCGAGLGTLLLAALPAAAQVDPNQTVNQAGTTAGQVAGQVPGTVGQVGQTVGQLGNTAGNVVGGLNPTLQPVGQGVGNALNNLTQPDTVSSLLEFLSSVIPNHIEAHVNLDALRVDKLTVDIRGVDLRNLRVDLLVANSRNAGQARPVMNSGSGAAGGGTTGRGVSGNLLPQNGGLRGSSGSGFGGFATVQPNGAVQVPEQAPTGNGR